jgi:L-aspartate oxidase
MKHSPNVHRADYVVVGSGIAGLRAAIELSSAGNVLVLTKSHSTDSATSWAQGLAVALSDEDEVGLHEQDTIASGDGLSRPGIVACMVEEGPKYISELIEWGTQFDRSGTKLAFTKEAAHSRARILHANGDSTGREISRALLARAHAIPNIHLRSQAFTTELLVDSGQVIGLRFLDELHGSVHDVRAGAVLLATGGLGQIYRETTNPEVATGDGMAIAYEAGAVLSDMEFIQFHPTALAVKSAPRFLLSDALRSEGGILRNADLERFMKRYSEAQEVAPRDVVVRAIVSEMQRTRSAHVYLDMTAKKEEFLRKRFPRIYETCLTYGLDLATDMAPVCPAAHYMVGGVKTDSSGRTSLPGLYAAGETAATGVHGANRVAGNGLLEGLVFGARAGEAMKKDARPAKRRSAALTVPLPGNPAEKKDMKSTGNASPASPPLAQIQELMWREAGIMRSGKELNTAIQRLEAMEIPHSEKPSRSACELENLHRLALLIARSALARAESRGSHYRSDFPYRDDELFQKHSAIQKGKDVKFES